MWAYTCGDAVPRMGYHVNIVCSQVLSCACRLLPLPLHQPSHSHRQQRQLPHNPCPPSLPHHYSFLRLPSEPQRLHFWRTIKLHACAQSLFSACCTCLLYQIPLAGCLLRGSVASVPGKYKYKYKYYVLCKCIILITQISQILTNFRVCAVLYDNSSCLIGSVSCVDPPGGAEHHGRSHSEPVLCVWGGCRELLSLRECEILCVSAGALQGLRIPM